VEDGQLGKHTTGNTSYAAAAAVVIAAISTKS